MPDPMDEEVDLDPDENDEITKSLKRSAQDSLNNMIMPTKVSRLQTKMQYEAAATGPYVVLCESTKDSKLHEMGLARILCKEDIKFVKAESKGSNRVKLTFSSRQEANRFMTHPRLNILALKAYMPSSSYSCIGVIKQLDPTLTTDELEEEISKDTKILGVRFLAKEEGRSGQSYVAAMITFPTTELPRELKLFNQVVPVMAYIPRVLICHNCSRYGHTAQQCKTSPAKQRCNKCSGSHATAKCDASVLKCPQCSGPHAAADKKCPILQKEKRVKKLTVLDKLSYAEALQKVNSSGPRPNKPLPADHQQFQENFPALPEKQPIANFIRDRAMNRTNFSQSSRFSALAMEVEQDDISDVEEDEDTMAEVTAWRTAVRSTSQPLPQRQRSTKPKRGSSSQGTSAYDNASRVSIGSTPPVDESARPPGKGLSTPAAQRTDSAPPAADAAGYHVHPPPRQREHRESVPEHSPSTSHTQMSRPAPKTPYPVYQSPTWVNIFTEFVCGFLVQVFDMNESTVNALVIPVMSFLMSKPNFTAFANKFIIARQ